MSGQGTKKMKNTPQITPQGTKKRREKQTKLIGLASNQMYKKMGVLKKSVPQ